MTTLLRTPFFEKHERLGGKFVDFFGWELPVQFAGIIEEHRHVREKVGIFDVSHMGEIRMRGPRAVEAIDRVITNHVGGLANGQACYSAVCLPSGGIVDDVIAYRIADDDILVCCNASNRAKDVAWFQEQAGALCDVSDVSDQYGQLAVQGPLGPEVVAGAFPELADRIREMPPFHHVQAPLDGVSVMISTTGYTGEKGFELYIPTSVATLVWERLWEAGQPHGIAPIGLGARDTLRLEMKFCLYGNDIDETTTPLEAGIGWTVKFDKGDFVGREALETQREQGLRRKLVAFKMEERGIPRQGYPIVDVEDPSVRLGVVTSGTQSPSLGEPIGLGYVDVPNHKRGKRIGIEMRGKVRRAKIVRAPFVETTG